MQTFGSVVELGRYIILGIGLSFAVWQDICDLRIKNKIHITVAAAGMILSVMSGPGTILSSIEGFFLPFICGFLFYRLNMLGAGDVKLLMGLGTLMGKDWIIDCMIYSVFSGGVIAVGIMLYHRIFFQRMKYALNYMQAIILTRKLLVYQTTEQSDKKHIFPFAIAIACGSMLACTLGGIIR